MNKEFLMHETFTPEDNPHSDLPPLIIPEYRLDGVWDKMPIMLGRFRLVQSQLGNAENVILCVEFRTSYVRWSVSPPDPDWSERLSHNETIYLNDRDRDEVITEAQRLALEAYQNWVQERMKFYRPETYYATESP